LLEHGKISIGGEVYEWQGVVGCGPSLALG
jgi:hypothetical protein